MHRPLAFAALLATTGLALAQQPNEERPQPVALVSQAEKALLRPNADVESAVVMLWQALDLLALAPPDPVKDATIASARDLLQRHDPLEADRRRVLASVARQQVDLATTYRNKKWFDVAANRLGVADRYDADVGAKEHAAITTARQKLAASPPAPAKKDPNANKPCPLLQRANAVRVLGVWREVGDCLESPDHPGNLTEVDEWVPDAEHGNHEIVVEWKPVDPTTDHNGGLWVAFTDDRAKLGLRVLFHQRVAERRVLLDVVTFTNPGWKSIGHAYVETKPQADGFHRLAARVSDNHLAVILDNAPPLEVDAGYPLRGKTGVLSGLITKLASCPIRFRNLRIDPLPADQPDDAKVLAAAEAETRDAITKAVTEGKALTVQKQPEAASIRFREALTRVEEMPPGVLRDNLRKSIDPLLVQVDSLTGRRRKVAETCGAELAALADRYAAKGMLRAALALAGHAETFDAAAYKARVQSLRDRVQQWNIAQTSARASELAPPADDGTVMREWFATGKRLIDDTADFTFDGAIATATAVEGNRITIWLTDAKKPKLTKASVFVRPGTPFVNSGLAFDIVGPSEHTIAMVDRCKAGLRVVVHRWAARKWVTLAEQTLPVDDWRLDGWFQLTVESNEQGLVVQCADIKLEVPRSQLSKQTGSFGLVVGNYGKKVAGGELRGFQPGQ